MSFWFLTLGLLTLLGGVFALLGAWLARLARPTAHSREEALIDEIDARLPQTQCAQCGYPGCRPYARAIALDAAPINRCPPGGENTIAELATLLGRRVISLDSTLAEHKAPQVAIIDESECIGCTLCLPACPVDAIVGAPRLMHTVIAADCTGCELCIAPCPVDCIHLVVRKQTLTDWRWPAPVASP